MTVRSIAWTATHGRWATWTGPINRTRSARFDGARLIPLPVPTIEAEPTYDTILAAAAPPASGQY